ncbi:hypothetical protein [Bacillus suaedae]|uniref:Uncharacterized protein n=1 Tax=Halalkalibacter suaedae TaxID=2822140 RepID=A0A941AQ69_9BACI|nr:hypothetical protein [Bacillus suaedae]MBP3952481.1 hypothetical protein [Bacillus suaedae]
MRNKLIFLVLFIILLFLFSKVYGLIYYYMVPWKANGFTSIITVLLYLIGVVPLTALVSEKILKSYLNQG